MEEYLICVAPGFLLMITGFFHRSFPPENTNYLLGVPRKLSSEDPRLWTLANKLGANMTAAVGAYMIPLGLAFAFFYEMLFSIIITIATGLALHVLGLIRCEIRFHKLMKSKKTSKAKA